MRSDWEVNLGDHESSDVVNNLPFAIERLYSSAALHAYDASGIGNGNDVEYSTNVDADVDADDAGTNPAPGSPGIRIVRTLSQKYFRERLVENFDIRFQQQNLVWPKRNGGGSCCYI